MTPISRSDDAPRYHLTADPLVVTIHRPVSFKLARRPSAVDVLPDIESWWVVWSEGQSDQRRGPGLLSDPIEVRFTLPGPKQLRAMDRQHDWFPLAEVSVMVEAHTPDVTANVRFAEFVAKFGGYLRYVIRRSLSAADVHAQEDVFQEVCRKLSKNKEWFGPEAGPAFPPARWLCKVTINTCRDHMRSNKRQRAIPLDAEIEPPARPSEGMVLEDFQGILETHLGNFIHRRIAELRFVEDLALSEIASQLGLSTPTVCRYVQDIRKILQVAIGANN